MTIENLPWDSQFFNLRIGRLNLMNDIGLNELAHSNYDVIYLFINNELQSLKLFELRENFEVYLADIKEVYIKESNTVSDLTENIAVYTKNDECCTELEALAIQSGIFSRFNLDPRFSNQDFERLYLTWLYKSLDGTLAKKVYIYKMKDKITGFVTLDYTSAEANIGLIGVDKEYRGMGIGTQLMASAENEVAQRGIKFLEVATQQRNQPATNLYLKTGFNLKSQTYIYHLWKK